MSTHDHSHAHAASSRKRLSWALGITATVLVAEVVGGLISGSLALLADAGHMTVDSLGLVTALIAATLMAKPRGPRRTWGWARAEVIAAMAQALFLIGVCITILWEALHRLADPVAVEPGLMLLVGTIGLAANVASMMVLAGGRKDSLNLKAAFLEVLTDALGSVAVIVAAIVLATTGWPYADSVASLLIAILIIPRAGSLLHESLSIVLESAPRGLDVAEVERHLLNNPAVASVHDLHATTIGTGVISVTTHVVLRPEATNHTEVLHEIQACIHDHFPRQINHLTVQLDASEDDCVEVLEH